MEPLPWRVGAASRSEKNAPILGVRRWKENRELTHRPIREPDTEGRKHHGRVGAWPLPRWRRCTACLRLPTAARWRLPSAASLQQDSSETEEGLESRVTEKTQHILAHKCDADKHWATTSMPLLSHKI